MVSVWLKLRSVNHWLDFTGLCLPINSAVGDEQVAGLKTYQ